MMLCRLNSDLFCRLPLVLIECYLVLYLIQISAGAFVTRGKVFKPIFLLAVMEKVFTHKRYADKCVKNIDNWKISESDKKAMRRYLEDYKSGEVTNKIGTNIDTTIERQTQFLKPCLEFVHNKSKKELLKLRKKDKQIIKNFKEDLLKDKIKSQLNKNYSLRVKIDMLSSFARFLDYILADKELGAILSKTLKVRIERKESEPNSLTEQEVDKLYKHCKNAKERYFISVLFGSGARAEEFHNIRYSDLTLPQGKENFVKLRLRNPYSKTKGRTISLYYKFCLESIRDYLEERKGIDLEAPIFETSYDSMRIWLYRHGNKVLNKNVHYHLARDTCATLLADKMNRQQLCVYFGWKFSSTMVDKYINRKGVDMNIIDNKMASNEFEKLQQDLNKEKLDRAMQFEGLKELLVKAAIGKAKISAEEEEKIRKTILEAIE